MMRILKIVAGVIFWVFASIWLSVQFVASVQGAIAVPAEMTSTQATILALLKWLATTPPSYAVLLCLGLYAFGFGLLFWHPEKGWAFYFERRRPSKQVSLAPPIKVAPLPTAGKTLSLSEEKKEFTEKHPKDLMLIFSSHNSLQAEKLFEPYVGIWIRVEGKIQEIKDLKHSFAVYLATDGSFSGIDVCCHGIQKTQSARLMRLGKSEKIAVIGRIKECNAAWLTLGQSEIIATNLPALPPPIPAPRQPQSKT